MPKLLDLYQRAAVTKKAEEPRNPPNGVAMFLYQCMLVTSQSDI